jgi:DNA-binding CsgD family transcriptional regulator
MPENTGQPKLAQTLSLIEHVLSATSAAEFRRVLVDGLSAMFESVSCVWTELKLDRSEAPSETDFLASISDESIDVPAELEVFSRVAEEHPVIRHVAQTGDQRAVSISELIDQEAFRTLPLYQEFYAAQQIEDQLSIGYVERGYLKGISINRGNWGFEDSERQALMQTARCVFPYYRLLQNSEGIAEEPPPLIETTIDAIGESAEMLGITSREAELLAEVARGRSNKQIAVQCAISEGTVRKHLENAFRTLGVTNRVSAVIESMQRIREA